MKRFRFRLQRLLDVAGARRLAQAQVLGAAVARVDTAVGKAQEIGRHRAAMREGMGRSGVGLAIEQWTSERARYLAVAVAEAEALALVAEVCASERAERQRYLAILGQQRALLRLRSRRLATWRELVQRREQAELDEIGGRRPWS